jgi:hypothetical protein
MRHESQREGEREGEKKRGRGMESGKGTEGKVREEDEVEVRLGG